jgi:hypothetical protein
MQPLLAASLTFVSYRWIILNREGRTPWGSYNDLADASTAMATTAGIVAFLVSAGIYPLIVYWVTRRSVSVWSLLLLGLLIANLVVLIPVAMTGGGRGFETTVRLMILASLLGTVGAAVFWRVSLRGYDFRQDSTAEHKVI